MSFVEVLIADAGYHGQDSLTYASTVPLSNGDIVSVSLRQKKVLGIVEAMVGRPAFAAKPIIHKPALPPIPGQLLQLLSWIKTYYPAPLGILTQLLLPKSLPIHPLPVTSLPTLLAKSQDLPPLTQDQQRAIQAIGNQGLHVLHGETGTGKTRVYIELVRRCLHAGRSAVVLTPEIGLTSQLAIDFRRVFGDRVLIVHSGLTDATRSRTWQYILEQTEPLIVVGARSALFSPLRQLGLIVVDEAHETSYKQDQAPYYHTTPVAAKLAAIHKATLVLGSATPLITDYYIATAKKRPIIRMTETAAGGHERATRSIEVVDLKDKASFSASSFISDQLLVQIKKALHNRTQSLLFLNRRGTARVIFCEHCGWQATCRHCDLPLVYHGDSHTVRCHSCSFKSPSPSSCPDCHNTAIVFRSIGTKAVTDEIRRLIPEARIMRFDTDNKKSERIDQQYDAVRQGDVDIIVGTQTLAKGLDLPRLAVVGVLIADTGLYLPDFSAQERTYQLLHQVLGRVGRGHQGGQVIIQTYNPGGTLLQAVLKKDWKSFYNKELDERAKFVFPPFCYLLRLSCKRASVVAVQRAMEQYAATLRSHKYNIIIEGPTPSFHEKTQNKFVWQLVIKTKQRSQLVQIITTLPSGWSYDIDPMNLL